MSERAYFIQYKFIFPGEIKHSSYTYQKLFRAIYGYTQSVNKSNGKVYKYHRAGILSNYPVVRVGKNCVIIPQEAFKSLQDFFKTGINPAHNWVIKGDWKCTYFLNEKDITTEQMVKSIKDLLARKFVENIEGSIKLNDELNRLISTNDYTENYLKLILNDVNGIINQPWFKSCYLSDQELLKFYENYKILKAKLTN
ncbi:MAG: hypothetical protein PHQ98_00090 [Candidatus ainarchaeum sp.]|nr:hypothetical protein [Candidatus ainarchaeum sp.]